MNTDYLYQAYFCHNSKSVKSSMNLDKLKEFCDKTDEPMYIEQMYIKATFPGQVIYKNQAMQDLESDTVYRFQHPNE